MLFLHCQFLVLGKKLDCIGVSTLVECLPVYCTFHTFSFFYLNSALCNLFEPVLRCDFLNFFEKRICLYGLHRCFSTDAMTISCVGQEIFTLFECHVDTRQSCSIFTCLLYFSTAKFLLYLNIILCNLYSSACSWKTLMLNIYDILWNHFSVVLCWDFSDWRTFVCAPCTVVFTLTKLFCICVTLDS